MHAAARATSNAPRGIASRRLTADPAPRPAARKVRRYVSPSAWVSGQPIGNPKKPVTLETLMEQATRLRSQQTDTWAELMSTLQAVEDKVDTIEKRITPFTTVTKVLKVLLVVAAIGALIMLVLMYLKM